MTRSVLQPIRPRRLTRPVQGVRKETRPPAATLTPGTRKTLAAIGALWISFATTASAGVAVTDLPRAQNTTPSVVFLTTGKRPDGSVPPSRMPDVRRNRADAAAVVAYLKSLSK